MNKTYLILKNKTYIYSDLLKDINNKDLYSPYIYVAENNLYTIFLNIIHSLLYQYPVELLDGDFSEYELGVLGLNPEKLTNTCKVQELKTFTDIHEIVEALNNVKNWTISLYTSGTTGKPKKITHTFETIIRNVKVNEYFSHNVWAFCYNPTHIAGLQVFLQAFFNLNTIVYTFDKKSQDDIEKLIEQYKVTNISATSTYYRMVLPRFKNMHECVKHITFGGEKYDNKLLNTISNLFPNAKVRNIYASTEGGTLFTSVNECFNVDAKVSRFVRTNESNELCLHRSLLGRSEHFQFIDEWYNTGDLVEWIDKTTFRFVSRSSEMINVGGYKVNPTEVEGVLLNVSGVIDLVVKGRTNKLTGQIIVADVVKEDGVDEKELAKKMKLYAAEHLQSWKIPRIISFVEVITKTRTGKKGRV